MRTVRVYADQQLAAEATTELSREASQHLIKVLRMKPGDAVTLFNGDGMNYTGTITAIERTQVSITVSAAEAAATESNLRVHLWHGLCRGGRMDTVVQKATELGVASVTPVLTERGVVKLDQKREAKRLEHWRKVAISAAEQSGRSTLPEIHAPCRLETALQTHQADLIRFMPDPAATAALEADMLATNECVFLTGPEGGFTAGERAAAQQAGFRLISLGPRVLRTETAPLTVISIAQYLRGDLGP